MVGTGNPLQERRAEFERGYETALEVHKDVRINLQRQKARLTEELNEMRTTLTIITKLGGNLSDKRLGPESIGGVNDGKARAIMYVEARKVARDVLAKWNRELPYVHEDSHNQSKAD